MKKLALILALLSFGLAEGKRHKKSCSAKDASCETMEKKDGCKRSAKSGKRCSDKKARCKEGAKTEECKSNRGKRAHHDKKDKEKCSSEKGAKVKSNPMKRHKSKHTHDNKSRHRALSNNESKGAKAQADTTNIRRSTKPKVN